jgi:GAF domain-containing protein
VGLYIPAASVEAARLQQQQQQQQQQAARAAGVEGPYSSYLDAELLNLYSEFKTTRQQVRIDCYSAA